MDDDQNCCAGIVRLKSSPGLSGFVLTMASVGPPFRSEARRRGRMADQCPGRPEQHISQSIRGGGLDWHRCYPCSFRRPQSLPWGSNTTVSLSSWRTAVEISRQAGRSNRWTASVHGPTARRRSSGLVAQAVAICGRCRVFALQGEVFLRGTKASNCAWSRWAKKNPINVIPLNCKLHQRNLHRLPSWSSDPTSTSRVPRPGRETVARRNESSGNPPREHDFPKLLAYGEGRR